MAKALHQAKKILEIEEVWCQAATSACSLGDCSGDLGMNHLSGPNTLQKERGQNRASTKRN